MSKDTPEVGDVIIYKVCLFNLKGHIHTIKNDIVYPTWQEAVNSKEFKGE